MFDGIRTYGSIDQRVMGTFIMNDCNHDRVLDQSELAVLITDAAAVPGQVPSGNLQASLDTAIVSADKNWVCFIG